MGQIRPLINLPINIQEKILDEIIKIEFKLWNKKIKDDLKKLGHSRIPSYNSKENVKIKHG